jgi:hypothetical protein
MVKMRGREMKMHREALFGVRAAGEGGLRGTSRFFWGAVSRCFSSLARFKQALQDARLRARFSIVKVSA